MFSQRLRSILEEKEISQIQLAKELNLSGPAINKWCQGITEPDNSTLVKVAKLLNVSTDFLLGNDELPDIDEQKVKENEILKKILIQNGYITEDEDISKDEINRIMAFIKTNKQIIKQNKIV